MKETGYVTLAERPPDADDYPDADPDLLVPGSLVFVGATRARALDDVPNWWEYVPGRVLAATPAARARRSTVATTTL